MDKRNFLKTAALATGGIAVTGCSVGGWRAHQAGLVFGDDSPFAPWNALSSVKIHDPKALAAAAILASNPHNTQPWRIYVDRERFEIAADEKRHLGAFDPYQREMWIGLGGAIANAEIAGPGFGLYASAPKIVDAGDNGKGSIRMDIRRSSPVKHPLAANIQKRRTNRAPYKTDTVPAETMSRVLGLVGKVKGARLVTFDRTSPQGRAFAEGTLEGTRAINSDHEMSQDGHAWFRGTARKVAIHRDGVSVPTAGLSPIITFLGQILSEADAEQSGKYWLASTERQVSQTGGFGLIVVDNLYDRERQTAAGRLWQRLHLALTAEGLAAQPMNQLPELVDRDRQTYTNHGWKALLHRIVNSDESATFAFRFGYPTKQVPHSARRPLKWVTKT